MCKRAGSVGNSKRYSKIAVAGVQLQTHRAVYCIFHNITLKDIEGVFIDHIDGDRMNNNPENLRIVNARENMQNLPRHRKGSLVGAHKHGNRWRSRIEVGGKAISLGCYSTEQLAHEAYCAYLINNIA